MATEIEIDGIKLVPIKEASAEVSYSRDYVTRLAREGKIVASLIGRQWFVDCQSLKNYFAQSQAEAEFRKAQLSEERKQEQLFLKEKAQQADVRLASSSRVPRKAILMAGFVLSLGLAFGVLGQLVVSPQLAAVSTQSKPLPVEPAADSSHSAAAPVVLLEDSTPQPALEFSSKEVTELVDGQAGILLLPTEQEFTAAEVFSDEVEIRTASSGVQSAVLVSRGQEQPEKEIPFVLVPVKTDQN